MSRFASVSTAEVRLPVWRRRVARIIGICGVFLLSAAFAALPVAASGHGDSKGKDDQQKVEVEHQKNGVDQQKPEVEDEAENENEVEPEHPNPEVEPDHAGATPVTVVVIVDPDDATPHA